MMKVPPEDALHYPFGDRLPEPGRSIEVAPGVRWLRLPLPFALDHVNAWLLRDHGLENGREGWAAVDCGIDDAATREAWRQAIESELGGQAPTRVIVTHMHPDHIGLAHWLVAMGAGAADAHGPPAGAGLWMSAADWAAARLAMREPIAVGGDAAAAFFALHGLVDPASLARIRGRSGYFASMVPAVPAQFHRLLDGHRIAVGGVEWRCIDGHGHSPEHIALHSEALGVLIAGDMLLPRISTNVSVLAIEPEGDPLPLYLASIDRFASLPAGTLVLPSHGRPFIGAATRVEQLHAHHRERLAEALVACRARPTSAAELLPVLFKRTLDLHQTSFAIGEAIAHLHALRAMGRIERRLDADGVLRFAANDG